MEHVAAEHATREVTRRDLARLAQTPSYRERPFTATLSEADRLAIDRMDAAGYDPQALASYIGRLQPAGNADPASELPDRDLRITAIGNRIQQLASGDEFSSIQAEVRRIVTQ